MYFGRLNEIYFHFNGSRIASVADRSRRTQPIPFADRLLGKVADAEKRTLRSSSLEGLLDVENSDHKQVVRAERAYDVLGDTLQHMELGGCTLHYDTLECVPTRTRVLLTISVPNGCVYEVESPLFNERLGDKKLTPPFSLVVHATSPWTENSGKLRFDCTDEPGEIAFLFESSGTPHPIARTAVVCAPGREIDAVVARAALGIDFVPALVLPHMNLWADILKRHEFDRILVLPTSSTQGSDGYELIIGETVRHSAPIREALGLTRRSREVITPETDELLGPALFIAVACDADLRIETDASAVELREGEAILSSWERGALLNQVMPNLAGVADVVAVANDEMVFCEAVLGDLLIVQAVGYAASHRLPIAFLEASRQDSDPEPATFEAYRDRAERMVPPELRAPSQPALTVFTRSVPLHLVRKFTGAQWPTNHWATDYVVSHLPGQSASVLIPRWFGDELERVSPVSLSIFYNGLGSRGQEDGAGLGAIADQLLNHLMTLDGDAAKAEVLRETLERLPTAMVLIAAHGAERAIELEHGLHIQDTEIANWRLAGSPVVFNNSCSSWSEVGHAFLLSGARAYVGTLWEVTHEVASAVASRLLQHILAVPNDSIANALAAVLADHAVNISTSHGSYIYVGLPQASTHIEHPLNRYERLETAALALHNLYGFLHQLIDDGQMRVAKRLQPRVHDTVVTGFSGLLEPDDPVPLPLPPPIAGTLLDLGFVMGTANVQALRRMAQASPTEEQEPLLMQCLSALDDIIEDLSSWTERHREFQAARMTEPDTDGGVMDSGHELYRLLVNTAYEVVLPLAKDCCDVSMTEAAQQLFVFASVMVTINSDLKEGTPPTPLTVLQRIRQGVPQSAQVFGSSETIEYDQLENAVNRSDLANRFGILLRGLGDETSALAFFELAAELAADSSPDHFSAEANRWRQADPLSHLPQLFEQQFDAGDFNNAGITGANLLRAAGAANSQIHSDLLRKIEAVPDKILSGEARAAAECQLFGGLAVYHAGLSRFEEAETYTDRIGDHLSRRLITEPGGLAHATTSARALFEHYYDSGSFAAACEEGSRVAYRLHRAELLEETLRVHFAVCTTAIDGYGAMGSDCFLTTFLEHSALAGQLVRDRPGLANDLTDMVYSVAENTSGIWRQAEANGQLEMALHAYDAQRYWPNGVTDSAWEVLRAARSDQNLATVSALASTGDLRRAATVIIGDDLSVSAEVTTSRSATEGPPVISMWPLTSHLASLSGQPDDAQTAARHVLMTLAPNDVATLREADLPHLHSDSQGACLYSDVWGSRTIGYTLELLLPTRLLPQKIRVVGVARDTVAIEIRFVSDGCEVRIMPHDDEVRWIGRLDIFCFDIGDATFPFTATDGPFGDWVPVEIFEHMMDLLGRSSAPPE